MKKLVLQIIWVILISGVPFFNTQAGETVAVKSETPFVVYYFMYEPRCMTCNKIEDSTKAVYQNHFKKDIESGQISFHTVDVGKDENKHFMKDFSLFTKSIVLVEQKNGVIVRHKVLQKVWELVHDEGAFSDYIQQSIEDFVSEQ